MNSTRTSKIESRLNQNRAEVDNNRRLLNELRNDFTNQLKSGKHPDQLTDQALKISELQARQTTLEAAVQVAKDQLEESKKFDASTEAKNGRKRMSELSDQYEGLVNYAWRAANDLVEQLQRLDETASEYKQIHKQIDGEIPNLHNNRRGRMMRTLHGELSRWIHDANGLQLKF